MISNFHATIFESHQFLFQFWKGICLSSRNISDNLARDGFRPQFYYQYRGDISFLREGFCRTYLFQHVGCGNLFLVLREFFSWDFFVLNQGKQKGYNSFWWQHRQHISLKWRLWPAIFCYCSNLIPLCCLLLGWKVIVAALWWNLRYACCTLFVIVTR